MSAAERLDEYLRTGETTIEPEHPYAIGANGHPLQEAEWACKKLAHLTGQRDDNSRAADVWIESVKAWLARENTGLANDIAYFEHLLIDWHQRELQEAYDEAGGDWAKVKGKTRRLPSGVVAARMTPERVEVEDVTFLSWVLGTEYDALYRTKYEPDKAAIKEHIKETGEVVPGVTIVPGDVTFKVTVGADAKKERDE